MKNLATTAPTFTPATLTVHLARQRHPAVGRNRIYEGIRAGRLKAVQVGRRLAIAVEDMDAWVAAGCPTGRYVQDREGGKS